MARPSTAKHTAAYWRSRARQARALANQAPDTATQRQLQIARSCEVLAEILERQSNQSDRCRAAKPAARIAEPQAAESMA